MYEVHYSEHVTDVIREFARRNVGRKAELLAALRSSTGDYGSTRSSGSRFGTRPSARCGSESG
jgi:hypothetical protein